MAGSKSLLIFLIIAFVSNCCWSQPILDIGQSEEFNINQIILSQKKVGNKRFKIIYKETDWSKQTLKYEFINDSVLFHQLGNLSETYLIRDNKIWALDYVKLCDTTRFVINEIDTIKNAIRSTLKKYSYLNRDTTLLSETITVTDFLGRIIEEISTSRQSHFYYDYSLKDTVKAKIIEQYQNNKSEIRYYVGMRDNIEDYFYCKRISSSISISERRKEYFKNGLLKSMTINTSDNKNYNFKLRLKVKKLRRSVKKELILD